MIRRLEPDEWQILRHLRLAALADAPDAFGSTYAAEAVMDDDAWRARLRRDGNPTFVWESGENVSGMVIGLHDRDSDQVVHLAGMWVAPAMRGGSVSDDLVDSVITWAQGVGARVVRLVVVEGNQRAQGLYRRHCFRPTGSTIRDRDGAIEVTLERTLA